MTVKIHYYSVISVLYPDPRKTVLLGWSVNDFPLKGRKFPLT
jgi:hypothetical protein